MAAVIDIVRNRVKLQIQQNRNYIRNEGGGGASCDIYRKIIFLTRRARHRTDFKKFQRHNETRCIH